MNVRSKLIQLKLPGSSNFQC